MNFFMSPGLHSPSFPFMAPSRTISLALMMTTIGVVARFGNAILLSTMSDQQGEIWVPKLSPVQYDIFNCGTEADGWKRFILVDGGRMNGKSIGVGHRIFRHLWETPGARVGLVAKT